jgi:hypothetical protein
MAAKLTRLTHKIAIQLHIVAQTCTICSSRSRRLVRKILDTPSYLTIKMATVGWWGGGDTASDRALHVAEMLNNYGKLEVSREHKPHK